MLLIFTEIYRKPCIYVYSLFKILKMAVNLGRGTFCICKSSSLSFPFLAITLLHLPHYLQWQLLLSYIVPLSYRDTRNRSPERRRSPDRRTDNRRLDERRRSPDWGRPVERNDRSRERLLENRGSPEKRRSPLVSAFKSYR